MTLVASFLSIKAAPWLATSRRAKCRDLRRAFPKLRDFGDVEAADEGTTVNTDIQIQTVGPPQGNLLITMYDRFDPLGAALGLPPGTAEARHNWIGNALSQIMNLAAFSKAGEVVGHCFLVADKPGSAEMAFFVHQEYRMRGIGAALIKRALEWGRVAELERVWAMTTADNGAALRLLVRCGFRLRQSDFASVELDIDLPTRSEASSCGNRRRLSSPASPFGSGSHAERAFDEAYLTEVSAFGQKTHTVMSQ